MWTRNDRLICTEIVEAIATYEDRPPHQLEFVLHDCINTDALERLADDGTSEWELNFRVPGHEVTVHSDRTILVDGTSVGTSS